MHLKLLAASAPLLLGILIPAESASQAAVSQAAAVPIPLRVQVVTRAEGAPLGYSVVSLPDQGIERFTNATGIVVIPVSAPGNVTVTVKRLGYLPRDTSIAVTESQGQSVVIALERVSFTLDKVTVVAWPPCRRPGIPRGRNDAQTRDIIEQLRQNGERYKLLTTQFPFTYDIERNFTRKVLNHLEESERQDTITINGVPSWEYTPGRMISRDPNPSMGGWIVHLPVLSDLADKRFIDNHCFHVAGLENKEGSDLLRIDIVAAERLRGPDVNATVWLDPKQLQLRYASFTLSTIPAQFRNLLHVVSQVSYVEVSPFIPVMSEVETENLVSGGANGDQAVSFMERQRILRLLYVGARPDQSESPPDLN